jgi:hypothetical protein
MMNFAEAIKQIGKDMLIEAMENGVAYQAKQIHRRSTLESKWAQS